MALPGDPPDAIGTGKLGLVKLMVTDGVVPAAPVPLTCKAEAAQPVGKELVNDTVRLVTRMGTVRGFVIVSGRLDGVAPGYRTGPDQGLLMQKLGPPHGPDVNTKPEIVFVFEPLA